MGRQQGSKNKRISQKDLTFKSIDTYKKTFLIIQDLIRENKLTPKQTEELTDIFTEMKRVIDSSNWHYLRGKNDTQETD